MSGAESPFGGNAGAGADATIASPTVIVKLRDSSYTERLASFLSSVGLSSAVVAPDRIDVTAASGRLLDASELEIYLRVWHVLEPEAPVEIER